MTLAAVDLGTAVLPDVMTCAAGWQATARSVIVAEGLLYYLPAAGVIDVLRQVAACAAAGSRFVFTYFEPAMAAGLAWWAAAGLARIGASLGVRLSANVSW